MNNLQKIIGVNGFCYEVNEKMFQTYILVNFL